MLLGTIMLVLGLSAPALKVKAASLPTPNVSVDPRVLGVAVRPSVVPAHAFTPDDPIEQGHPAFVHLAFGPQDPNRQEAALSVYPLAGLLKANQGSEGQQFRHQFAQLQLLIRTRPGKIQGELPYLLEPDAGQVFTSGVRYLNFAGGSGLRYLTMYSSDVSPVTSDRVFYTYQGLTSDGRYALVLTYPVSTRLLPATYDAVPVPLRTALAQGTGYSAYLSRTVRTLAAARPGDFTPALDKLDALVASIRIRH